MSSQTVKRYIVTYNETNITQDGAASILGAPSTQMQDGVSMLASDNMVGDSDVLHFEGIGASTVTLSDSDAAKLSQDSRVAEVIEDFDVFATEYVADGTYADDLNGSAPINSDLNAQLLQAYQQGYMQAMTQSYDQWSPAVDDASAMPSLSPVPPWPPLPRLPVWPPVKWPQLPIWPPRSQPAGWNIKMIKADQVWHRVTGRGVKVAVLDTGIDNNHPDLSVCGGVSFVPGVISWDDAHGHGTHCAGIIGARNNFRGVIGVAPRSELYAVKVLKPAAGGRASGKLSWILAGMQWAVTRNMDVVSMSLGSLADSSNARCIVAYQRAAQRLLNSGCLVVSSAGNSFGKPNPWVGQPARCTNFMAVAAVDRRKNIASFSSRGPTNLSELQGVEISAPGVDVRSTLHGGRYGNMSGTSMACPHVAGAAALLKELRPTWTPNDIRDRLKHTADDLGSFGHDATFGAGLLNCHRAVFG